MPIYEYECRKCHAHTEVMQKMTDKPLVKCRKCGGRLEKQWSPTSFQLKGSGWYATDYAGKKSEAKEEKSTATKEETAASTETKNDTSETKSDTSEKAKPAADKSASKSNKSSSKTASSKTSGE